MTRIQLACCFLLASAFLLGGILLVMLDAKFTSTAYATQTVSTGDFSILTAQTQNNEESLFIIDNVTARLMIVETDINKKRLRVAAVRDLDQLFRTVGRR